MVVVVMVMMVMTLDVVIPEEVPGKRPSIHGVMRGARNSSGSVRVEVVEV